MRGLSRCLTEYGLSNCGQAPGLLLTALLLTGCAGEDATGPGEVRWDRESCTRCAMAVSDRHYSAQVRGGVAGQKTRLYKFDDIGCAVVWLDQQDWKDDARTEIWVTDQSTGEWIDARLAHYVTGKLTPMDYGLGAQREAAPGAMDFTLAREHIYAVDERKHLHSGGRQHSESGLTPSPSGTPTGTSVVEHQK